MPVGRVAMVLIVLRKVANPHDALQVDEHVRRLDIAVQRAAPMSVFQRPNSGHARSPGYLACLWAGE
jgi:hypothetical protein